MVVGYRPKTLPDIEKNSCDKWFLLNVVIQIMKPEIHKPLSDDVLTIESLRKLENKLRDCSVKQHVVESEEQAKYMTEHDVAGHVWRVGEEYYMYFQR